MSFRNFFQFLFCFFFLCWFLPGGGTGYAQSEYVITIQPIITVSEEYTDNLFLSDQEKKDDFITIVTPGILVEAKKRTSELSFLYEAGYSSYARYSEFDSWRHFSDFKGFFQLSPHTRLGFRNTFLWTEEPTGRVRELFDEDEVSPPIDETPVVETETVRRRRERYYRDSTNISFVHQYGIDDQVSFIYNYDILNNQDASVRDREGHRPSAEIRHWLIPNELALQGGIRYSWEDVEDSTDELGYFEESIQPSLFLTYWVNPNQFRLSTGLSYTYGEYREEEPNRASEPEDTYYNIKPIIEWSYLYRPRNILFDGIVGYEKGRNDAEDRDLDPAENFEWWHGTFRLTHIFSRRLQGLVQYNQGFMDFDYEESDYILYSPSVGIQYLLAAETPLIFKIGYLFRDREIGDNDDAFLFSGELKRWRLLKDSYLSFLGESGYNNDNLGAERLGFGLYYRARALAEYLFTKNWTGSIFGAFEKNEYTDLEEKRDDAEVEFGSELIYTPSPRDWWTTFHLRYTYRDVDSTLDEDDYQENRIFLEIRLAPPIPYAVY